MTDDDSTYTARTEALLDCLIDRLDPDADPQAFPDLLTSLSWTNDDNGHAIELVRRRWLREGDRTRAALALALTESFPGGTREELVANVRAAADRFPELDGAAQAFIERWDAQVEPRRQAAAGSAGEASTSDAAAQGGSVAWESAAGTVPAMTLAQAAEFIADHPADNAPPKFLAEIFDELLPCLRAEARAELFAVRDAWIVGEDEWRAAIAAWMDTPAPGESADLLAARRAEVVARFPRVAAGDDGWKWSRG
jgi:hypothetical protein